MLGRRSLKLPIILAIVMIVLLIALIVGWVWVTVAGALEQEDFAAFYWTVLPIGTSFLVLLLAGTIVYLTLAIKTINLTQRQSNFIDSVTHELKSPIASLKLYLQTLSLHQLSDAEQASFRRSMLEDVERLDQLINHLLDAGRLERDILAPPEEEEDVLLGELLHECADTVRRRYRVPPGVVRFELAPCLVTARRGDLEIIFRNLIDNAVKYAGQQPEIDISLALRGGRTAVVKITDNGPGIPPPLRRKIFGRFVRVGLELERKKPGTGLGLYIVRTLARRLHGDVRAYDPDKGSGTVFEVRLPGKAAPQPAESPRQPADLPEQSPEESTVG